MTPPLSGSPDPTRLVFVFQRLSVSETGPGPSDPPFDSGTCPLTVVLGRVGESPTSGRDTKGAEHREVRQDPTLTPTAIVTSDRLTEEGWSQG